MISRRTLEGALKCDLRDLRRDAWRAASILLILEGTVVVMQMLTLGDFGHCD
jgi:hypothetical protein